MRTFDEAEAYVHSFTRFGSQLGLGRMRRLLEYMGNPQDSLKFVHVAGTNGKGSTVKLSANVLQEAGYTVGMYVSPFVVEFRERFQVNGQMIEKQEFAELVDWIDGFVLRLAQEGELVTEFEMITAVAFAFFLRRRCDIVVLEVGIGGRYDATNVIRTPECAIICSVSLDHTDLLGDTVAEIAGEKAGVIKPDTDVVTYPLQDPEAVAVLLEKCAATGSRLTQPNAAAVEILDTGLSGSRFRYGEGEFTICLAGIHQVYNAAAVIEAMRRLRRKGWNIPEGCIGRGLAETHFPARFEIFSREPLIVIDGAHNRQAAASLAQTLCSLSNEPKIAVMGMMRDKDHTPVLSSIGGACDAILTVAVPDFPRSASAKELASAAREFCPHTEAHPDYRSAVEHAVELAGKNGAVIVCGSFYLAGGMRPVVLDFVAKRESSGEKA